MLGQDKKVQSTIARGLAAVKKNSEATKAPAGANLPGPAPNTAGPHREDILNKLDPTVDSMHGGTQILGPGINARDERGSILTSHSGHGHGSTHRNEQSTTTNAGYTGAAPSQQYQTTSQGHTETGGFNANRSTGQHQVRSQGDVGSGPVHNSRLANEIDPRINTSAGGVAIPKNNAGFEHSPMGPTGGYHSHTHPNAPGVGDRTGGERRQDPSYTRTANQPDSQAYNTGEGMGALRGNTYDREHNTAGFLEGSAQQGSGHNTRFQKHPDRQAYTTSGRDADSGSALQGPGSNTHFARQPDSQAYTTSGSGEGYRGDTYEQRGTNTYSHDPSPVSDGSNIPRGAAHGHDAVSPDMTGATYQPSEVYGTQSGRQETTHGNTYADSGVRGTSVHQGPAIHPGPATKTSGPHNSNFLNKLDPRYDSQARVIDRKEYRVS